MKGTVPDDADLFLISHGHFDHSASAHEFVKNSKKPLSKVVSNYEICCFLEKNHGLTE